MTYEEWHGQGVPGEAQVGLSLNGSDRMLLTQFAGSEQAKALWKYMTILVYNQRDKSTTIHPSKKEEQTAEATVAFAMSTFFGQVKAGVEGMAAQIQGEARARVNKKLLEDREEIEKIALAQISPGSPVELVDSDDGFLL